MTTDARFGARSTALDVVQGLDLHLDRAREMLEELRIHRSSFVCAVLARLPGVTVEPGRAIVLRYPITP